MILKKNRAVSHLPVSTVLNCDDRKKFSAFVGLLVQVNKHINPDEYLAAARARIKKKTKKGNLEYFYKKRLAKMRASVFAKASPDMLAFNYPCFIIHT
jgi:hypothetical protein